MAQMHGKRLFTGIINVKGLFLFDVAPTYENEYPFRACEHSWVIHIWPGKALVVGCWRKKYDETSNLMKSVGGRVVSEEQTKNYIRRWTLQKSSKESCQDEVDNAS